MKDFDVLLARIAGGLDRGLIDQRMAAHYLGEHLCRRLYCSRVSMWTFSEAPVGTTLTRVGGFDGPADRPLGGTVAIDIASPSAWLGELLGRGVFASGDAAADRRLHALREAWLAPGRVGALLQATLASAGRACGFISCEQAGEARAWTREDALLLRCVADAVSRRRVRRLALAPA